MMSGILVVCNASYRHMDEGRSHSEYWFGFFWLRVSGGSHNGGMSDGCRTSWMCECDSRGTLSRDRSMGGRAVDEKVGLMWFKPLGYLLVTATQRKNASRRIPGTLTHWIALHALPETMEQNIQHEHCMDGGSIGSGTTQIRALAWAFL